MEKQHVSIKQKLETLEWVAAIAGVVILTTAFVLFFMEMTLFGVLLALPGAGLFFIAGALNTRAGKLCESCGMAKIVMIGTLTDAENYGDNPEFGEDAPEEGDIYQCPHCGFKKID